MTGKSVVSGISFTSSCWIGWRAVGELIGREQFWTAVPSAQFLGAQTGPNPTDRAKLGSKRHLLCDGCGVPLVIQLTGANRNDSQQALALVDAIPPLQGEYGPPRRRPTCVLGDRGYDASAIRLALRLRHIVPLLAKRNTGHGSGLGRWRWVVERTFGGSINFAAFGSGTRSAPTSTKPSCPSAVL